MGITSIKTLSMNPHFYSLLIQSFLTGYNNACRIKTAFLVLPILLHSDSCEKLLNANARSRIDTLFQSTNEIRQYEISGKTRMASFVERHNLLMPYCKDALIILSSENKIAVIGLELVLIEKIEYKNYDGSIKELLKCAYNLGRVFSKSSEEQVSFYLGVN